MAGPSDAGQGAGAPAAAAAASPSSLQRSSLEGARTATHLVDAAEERVEKLERVLSKEAEAHLGPAPATEGEEATVHYFAYGSNINKKVFEGRRRIKPAESFPAVLPGWKLQFSQPGLPFSEPAFAAVEPASALAAPAAAGSSSSRGADAGGAAAAASSSSSGTSSSLPDVHGVVHRITPSQWAYVLETEGGSGQDSDHAYRVVEAQAQAYDGRQVTVVTLTVSTQVKARLQGRAALPSLRYLTLIRDGAADYGLAEDYRAWLQELRHYQALRPGQRVGAWLFGCLAMVGIFPVWAGVRLIRRFTGMEKASNDALSRFVGRYTAACFSLIQRLHEALRPVLGCGMTSGPA